LHRIYVFFFNDTATTEIYTLSLHDALPISVEALENGEDVKLGKLFKIFLQEVPYKRAYDGLNKEYFDREAKRVPKLQPLKRLEEDRKSTRLNSSHDQISYAVFCLKKKKKTK